MSTDRVTDAIRIVALTQARVAQAARVHLDAMAGSRTARMGRAYVEAYLGWFAQTAIGGVALAALDGHDHLLGYAVGAPLGYAPALSRALAPRAAAAVARRPWLVLARGFRAGALARVRLLATGRVDDSAVQPDLPAPVMSLVAIGVAREARMQRVGTRLIAAFEAAARERRMRAMRASVRPHNAEARRLYESCGWHPFVAGTGAMYYVRLLDAAISPISAR